MPELDYCELDPRQYGRNDLKGENLRKIQETPKENFIFWNVSLLRVNEKVQAYLTWVIYYIDIMEIRGTRDYDTDIDQWGM